MSDYEKMTGDKKISEIEDLVEIDGEEKVLVAHNGQNYVISVARLINDGHTHSYTQLNDLQDLMDIVDAQYQHKKDSTLPTESKEVSGAITEIYNLISQLNDEELESLKNQLQELVNQVEDNSSQLEDNVNELNFLKLNGLINVKDFGAKGDGVTDDTEAILKATKSMYTNDRFGIFFPRGVYIVSDTISIKNKCIVGESRIGAIINSVCSDSDKPIIAIGGISKISDITVRYDESVECYTINPNQFVGIRTCDSSNERLSKTGSINNVSITNTGTGISDGGIGCFSVEFKNIKISNFSYAGVHMTGKTRTGNVWSNIYIDSMEKTCITGFWLDGEESECSIDQLNLEHFIGNTAVGLHNVLGYKIGTIHIEGVEIRNDWQGYIDISNSSGSIGVCTFYYTRLHKTGGHLFRLREGQTIISNQDTLYKDTHSYLKIGVLHCKGLNRPDGGMYPHITAEQKTLNNSPSFTFFFRDSGYDLESNNFYVEIEEYKWASWSASLSDDSEHYYNFTCDPHRGITFIKKGQIIKMGTTEQRPSVRLCDKYTTYFDTTLNKMIYYINRKWVDANGLTV